jgi:MYXO-CTERM domain-containing protein
MDQILSDLSGPSFVLGLIALAGLFAWARRGNRPEPQHEERVTGTEESVEFPVKDHRRIYDHENRLGIPTLSLRREEQRVLARDIIRRRTG